MSERGTPQLRPARESDRAAIEQLLTASALPLAGVAKSLADFVVAESDGAPGTC